jgi:TonB family protein
MIRRDHLFPYLVVSMLFHAVLYFMFCSREKPAFLPVPVEISFNSSYQQKVDLSPSAVSGEKIKMNAVSASGQKVIDGSRQRRIEAKEDIAVSKKEKPQNFKQERKTETNDSSSFAKSAEESKTEKKESLQNNGNAEAFQTSDSGRVYNERGAQYEIISFDAPNFKYSYYAGQIIRRIRRQWRWVENYGGLRAVIYFKIHRDGVVSDISIRESSGNSGYDEYALETVSRAAPFPDLPGGYESSHLGVCFEFKYRC